MHDNGVRMCDFEERLLDEWERHRNTTAKFIALFIDELDGLEELFPIKEMVDENRLSGIVTFGVHEQNFAASQPRGTSHFDIVADELKVPLLQLHPPVIYRDESGYEKWLFENPLRVLFGQNVQLNVSANTATLAPQ